MAEAFYIGDTAFQKIASAVTTIPGLQELGIVVAAITAIYEFTNGWFDPDVQVIHTIENLTKFGITSKTYTFAGYIKDPFAGIITGSSKKECTTVSRSGSWYGSAGSHVFSVVGGVGEIFEFTVCWYASANFNRPHRICVMGYKHIMKNADSETFKWELGKPKDWTWVDAGDKVHISKKSGFRFGVSVTCGNTYKTKLKIQVYPLIDTHVGAPLKES